MPILTMIITWYTLSGNTFKKKCSNKTTRKTNRLSKPKNRPGFYKEQKESKRTYKSGLKKVPNTTKESKGLKQMKIIE